MPEEWLEADIKQGISNSDVETRRKRMGWNEISSEKESLFIKFLMFFTGPVLYGMFVSLSAAFRRLQCVLCAHNAWWRPCFAFCKLWQAPAGA